MRYSGGLEKPKSICDFTTRAVEWDFMPALRARSTQAETWEWNSLEVEVHRQPMRRRLSLKMRPYHPLKILTNLTMSRGEIEDFLDFNADWIEGRLKKYAKLPPPARIHGRDGDAIPFLGETKTLRCDLTFEKRGYCEWAEGELVYYHPSSHNLLLGSTECEAHVRGEVFKFLAREAERYLHERAMQIAARVGLAPKRWRFASQNSRWGSCSSRQVISLNRRLIGAPVAVIDSVIAHELCHLVHMNHSDAFWSLLRSHVADLDECEKWLRAHGGALQERFAEL